MTAREALAANDHAKAIELIRSGGDREVCSAVASRDDFEQRPEVLQAGETLMELAGECGDADVVQALLDAGVSADDGLTQRPLTVAIGQRHSQIVRKLLDAGADVNAKDADGCTPLMGAAAAGCLEIVQMLVAAGADVNAEDLFGVPALAQAQDHGHRAVYVFLWPLSSEDVRSRTAQLVSYWNRVESPDAD